MRFRCSLTMANTLFFFWFSLFCLLASVQSYGGKGINPLWKLISEKKALAKYTSLGYIPVYVGPQDGQKEADKIETLVGQPNGVEFDQFSGYVTVAPETGRALFYYFVESPYNSSTKPLVLWLNGGPGCSSLGGGAMMELGPFRVNKDGQTLSTNEYAWNKEANIIFLESPAGVGFSYSNTTSDYNLSGDNRTAYDSYTFLVKWLERFPEYKSRDFYITGESYAGHYVPQLAQTILHNNMYANQTTINLRGIAIGNALIDDETAQTGSLDFYWSHALISDQMNSDIGNIYGYDIYAPLCNSSSESFSISGFDPCSRYYLTTYLNIAQVQKALHANVTSLPYPWEKCSSRITNWTDSPSTVLPILDELMANGMRVWLYSGDTDGVVPVTCTRYAIDKLGIPVKTPWYPWYAQDEVGGYVVEYENLTFVTVRGSGHFVPSYQPARALVLFSSFINGKLPPSE